MVSVSTMGRTLARLGARLGMPKPVVRCPWKRDAREARLAELRTLEEGASATEPVLYSDEVDVHLNPKIGLDWMLPGQQRRILTPGKNEKFYLAGALDVRTGALLTTGLAHRRGGARLGEEAPVPSRRRPSRRGGAHPAEEVHVPPRRCASELRSPPCVW